ncbi:hypothetical protein K440DRAFT_632052 [Wilcoxina mikolae CBS 423.85]|nr:hypothetical protein K440DRAFT_632052 [Wilcoxina mikolae CBS 423.85]
MSSALGPSLPASSTKGDSGVGGGASTNSNSRKMRLKISYSFDEGNKSNCLARWPHLINTPVVQVNRDLLVGAVEFRTCILSIIAGSPELVARLGPDYSVYAYDYSEPDIPLVGCGMLSWAMLNTQGSSTLMVTGRVNSNTFVFPGNDDTRETLEVKIRLQKVDTFTQEQFVNSVHAYQALSRALPGDFDASTWSNFLNTNPRVLTAALPAPPPPPPTSRQHSAAQTAPAINEPVRLVPSLDWKESSVSSSEDVVEPPKKKQRTRAPRPKKKKVEDPMSTSTTPAAAPPTPVEEPIQIPENLPPPPAPRPPRGQESSSVPQPSISRQSSATIDASVPPEISPSPQCNIMASSPPTQLEIAENTCIPSPAPTSPCLPSLPPPRANDPGAGRLETLFEEQEQEQETEPPRVKEEPQSDCVPQSCGLFLPKPVDPLLLPDDSTASAAPSPESSQFTKLLKKPKRAAVPAKKGVPFGSDAVIPSSEIGGDVQLESRALPAEKPKTVTKSRTAAHMKSRIETQLLEALKRGEMPKYCKNCGAIETGVWRRVKPPPDSQEQAEKDDTKVKGHYRREKEKELLLCNACGLWFLSHKTMRPQVLWESNKEEKSKGSNPRKRKKSAPAPTPPASSLSMPMSEPCIEPIVLADEDVGAVAPTSPERRSANRSESKENTTDWNAATDAGRRVACSSPVQGSAASPIDLDAVVDGMASPKRRLFPEARKSSPEKPVGHPMPKRGTGKENKTPDPETGNAIVRPTTPTAKRPTIGSFQQLRTPMRSASKPMQESSPCRSTRRTPRPVPATPERRLLKSPLQRKSMSPVAGLLEKLLAEDPSVLADIEELTAQINFDMDDDFLNTDYTMPSSPLPSSPPTGFALYQDPDGMSAADWSDFLPSTPNGGNGISRMVDELFDESKEGGMTVDLSAFIEEHTTSGGIVPPQFGEGEEE